MFRTFCVTVRRRTSSNERSEIQETETVIKYKNMI